MSEDWIRIDRLRAMGIIGLHEWERTRIQEIWIDAGIRVDLATVGCTDDVADGVNYGTIAREMIAHAETSDRYTVEALANDLLGICLHHPRVIEAVVKVSKPGAEPYARSIGVEMRRQREKMFRAAFISIGSNHDAETNLPAAAARLATVGEVVGVSRVLQSPAVEVPGSPDYLNAAALVRTTLPAGAIRLRLKAIEREMGRVGSDRRDPVPIDLDLCLLGDQVVRTGHVSIPHAEIVERAYLARTLADLDPEFPHPQTGEKLSAIAAKFPSNGQIKVRSDVKLSS